MRVSVDVYTKDVDAALKAFKHALEDGAANLKLLSSEDYETQKFEYLNLVFETDHNASILTALDNGPFEPDYTSI